MRKLKRLYRKYFHPNPPPKKPVDRAAEPPERVFRLDQWTPVLASSWKTYCMTPAGLRFLAVMYHSQPTGYPFRREELSATTAAVELGRKEGYMDALLMLEALQNPPKKNTIEELESEYKDPVL